MKICCSCKRELLIEEFYIRRNRPIGIMSECKKCTYSRNAQTILKRKIETFNHYGGCICNCCKEKELSFLSIDHINNDGAIERRKIGAQANMFYCWLKKNNYPSGFQVLCSNYNKAKWRYGQCPHEVDDEW